MEQIKLFLTVLAGALFFVSCSDDDAEDAGRIALGSYDLGTLVLNEGNFNTGNASVSYISDDFSVSQNDIFSIVNDGAVLGDVAQSVGFNNDLAYIVVNNSQKIEVVNRYTFKKVATINNQIRNPRYIAFANGKGYVTNWGDPINPNDDYVAIVNLSTQTVTSTIPVAEGPEQIVPNNGKLFVSHSGGFHFGNTVSVISNDAVSSTIAVGDVPKELQIVDGNLWVTCKGNPSYAPSGTTSGKFVKINADTNAIIGELKFPNGQAATNLGSSAISGTNIYYNIGTAVYKCATDAPVLPTTPAFDAAAQGAASIYGLAVNNGRIYVSDDAGFTVRGKVYVYAAGNAEFAIGVLLNRTTVGVGPSAFYFNN
ncbi:hypothetical protein FNO01nite_26930 [Flavobacterium noncentrifugens]|uniref:40-residue YVTN family beta-propeller repeat-containing protein n=1 Tax=Flavobacterium noncentrifugens TaxID=1128970 RepID=A0A1G9CG17_9FLAO|nr:DUF5074 domain-containing protein [Flavobacterium noncentrifugens]GEP52021.1 hypothetical protein FNO01nite_26930 [Flavobacterium noncentrifugens]SDK50598.1 hypothetical protein SAMN04487935_3513 [Flavobacterium noncentrifugens]